MGSYYDNAILADGPVAFWPLSDPVGATAADLSGSGHFGTYVGGCSQGATGIGDGETSVAFDGSTGYVKIGAGLQAGASPWTAECWLRTKTVGSQAGTLLSMGASRPAHIGTGLTGAVAGGSGLWAGRETSATVVDGAWHHGAITWPGSAGSLAFYVDGIVRSATIASATGVPIVSGSAPLFIGAGPNATAPFFAGEIAKMAIYGKALTASQVAAHYQAARLSAATATIIVHLDSSAVSRPIAITGGSPPGPVTPPVVT